LLSPDFHEDGRVKGIGAIENGVPHLRKLKDILKIS
jgi:hypothetical protein